MSTKRNRKASNSPATTFEHAALAVLPEGATNTDAAVLDSLLDEVVETTAANEVTGDVSDEIIETVVANDASVSDELLEGVEDDADQIAARQAVYAAQGSDAPTDGTAPETSADAVTGKKAKKPKMSAEEKAEAKKARDEKKAAERAAKPPKELRATSITHKPGALLVAKMGASWRDTVVLSMAVAGGDADALTTAQDEFIARMNDGEAIADKVKEKMLMLFTWLKDGKGADDLNEVMRRTFRVLHAKGELTSGDKGNLQLDLLAKPYSMGTARSQANQMFMALPELGITVKEKGKMVPNPDSALLPAINAKLGLV